ncbi:LysR family transcriptional regulator [Microvirga puerhi]|uniref:LysR family transcriptional regulator n=1 Tax=Microvirga puerhi TaxID=2876078 RepID=A0ABS7VLU2_9HYPH|nr:LysR family transcriptional regulator [Microvirga puerhi]MBZ6076503.1 LysR family transcriptional regulator [Microvirga puerhi]
MKPFDPDQRNLTRTPLDNEHILSGQFWGELRVFLAVAKAKSFNRAAELLNSSQPTVSRQVKRLQDLMGSQLFVPSQHGVKLTPKGQALAQALSSLDHSLFALTNDLRAENKEAEGIVRVSITDGLNTFFVAPAVSTFAAEYPKIQLHLKSPANVVSLRDNQTDMMIGFSPIDAADIYTQKLGALHFIPIVAKSYIQQHGIPTRSNLEQHLFLQSEFYTAKTGLWDSWNRAVLRGRIVHFCDNSMAYGMLVKAGLGIGLLGSYTILEPNAVPLELDVAISVPLYAHALTERLNAKPVRLAFDWLCDMFGSSNPWFGPRLRLDPPQSRFDIGIKLLFNL